MLKMERKFQSEIWDNPETLVKEGVETPEMTEYIFYNGHYFTKLTPTEYNGVFEIYFSDSGDFGDDEEYNGYYFYSKEDLELCLK